MALDYIQHFLLIARDIEITKHFYIEILELKVGYRPNFKFPGYWLYSKSSPLVHLVKAIDTGNLNGTGPIDHIAFHASDFEQTVAHLQKFNIPMQHRIVPEEGNTNQLFITDPDGKKIELNFSKDMRFAK